MTAHTPLNLTHLQRCSAQIRLATAILGSDSPRGASMRARSWSIHAYAAALREQRVEAARQWDLLHEYICGIDDTLEIQLDIV